MFDVSDRVLSAAWEASGCRARGCGVVARRESGIRRAPTVVWHTPAGGNGEPAHLILREQDGPPAVAERLRAGWVEARILAWLHALHGIGVAEDIPQILSRAVRPGHPMPVELIDTTGHKRAQVWDGETWTEVALDPEHP